MSHGISEEELALLSPEEREAVEADVDDAELTATVTPVDIDEVPAGEELESDPVPEGDDPPKVDDPKPAEGDDPPAGDPAKEDPPAKGDIPAADPEPAPEPEPIEDGKPEAAQQINPHEFSDAAKGRLTDLRSQLSGGDLSQAEYDEKADTIKADDYRTRQQAQSDANWFREVKHFLAAKENADYEPESNPVKFAALDGEIRRLSGTDEISGLTQRQILARAKENVEQAFGGKKEPAPKEDPKPAPKPAAKRPDEPNLGDIPAADVDNPRANASEFALLDKMGGVELEAAIEKLTPEQVERYSAGR